MSSDGLISAVRAGEETKVKELVNSFGATNTLSPLDGYVLLVEANENNHTEIVKFLLTSIIDAASAAPANLVAHTETNPDLLLSTIVILAAVNCDSIEVVEMLLKRNPTISKTLLFAAIQNNRADIVTLVLNQGFDVNAPSKEGISPLQYAIQINKILISETLLSRGINVKVTARSNVGAPLTDEYAEELLNVVKRLSIRAPCVTRKIGQTFYIDYNGYTDYMPLHVAIRQGNAEMVKLLLRRGADVDVANKDEETAFQLAVKKKRAYPKEKTRALILAYVVMSSLDLDGNNNNGTSSVLETVEASAAAYVDILSDCKCRRSHVTRSILQVIHDNRANDRRLLTSLVLHSAVERGYSRILKDSFDRAADVKRLYDGATVEGFTLLHSAVNSQRAEMAELLMTYGAEVNARDAFGKAPIYYAIENMDLAMTTRLLRLGADVRNSPELLNAAVRRASTEIVNLLLRFSVALVDVNAQDECGSTALHFTALQKEHKMGFNDKVSVAREEDSISDISVKADIAELLISRGATVDASNKRGQTALHAAAKRGYPEVVEVLLKHNADVAAVDNEGATPLHLAAWHTSAAIAEMLIRAKAEVNARRKDGSSVLRDAVVKGNKRVIELLLRHGADVNDACKCGKTLLECHTLNRHRKVGRMGRERWSEIADILRRHVVKMRAAGLRVSEKNVQALRDPSGRLGVFHAECSREIERMRSARIGANVSFYDVALGSPHQVAVYARFTSVVRCLEEAGYTKTFPIYRDWIQENFRRGQEREVLLVPGVDSLNSLLGYSVPDVLTIDVFGFLGNDDLRNLIEAGDRRATREDEIEGQDGFCFASRCSSRRDRKNMRRFDRRSAAISAISAVGRHMKCPKCGVLAEPALLDIVGRRSGVNCSARLQGYGHSLAHRKFSFYGSKGSQDCPVCSNSNVCPLRATKINHLL